MAWSKFYWSDWQADAGLRICSMAAQGFWMRLLCIAAEADPVGYVVIGGRALDASDLARLIGIPVAEVEILTSELERNGVFSRDRAGRIFSRKMRKQHEKSSKMARNGKKGGLAKAEKQKEIQDCYSKSLADDVAKSWPQKPEARSLEEEELKQPGLVPQPAREPVPPEAADDQRSPSEVCHDPEIADYRRPPDPPAVATTGSTDRDPRMRDVAIEVRRLARMTAPPGDATRVDDWLKAGADPDKHIFPTVERLAGSDRTIKVFRYFEAAIMEAVAADNSAHDAKIAYFERVRREAYEGMSSQEIENRKRHIEADRLRMERESQGSGYG